MKIVGNKLKMVNAIDTASADNLSTLHTIELVLTKSPKHKVRCGAIAIFKLNEIEEMDWNHSASPKELFEAKQKLNEMTDVMLRDPELFRETDGRWVPWAVDRVLAIFDSLNTDADIIVKSPRLKIRHKIKRSEVMAKRADPKKLFWVAFEISRLLGMDFAFDPWSKVIRKGIIGAEMSKR